MQETAQLALTGRIGPPPAPAPAAAISPAPSPGPEAAAATPPPSAGRSRPPLPPSPSGRGAASASAGAASASHLPAAADDSPQPAAGPEASTSGRQPLQRPTRVPERLVGVRVDRWPELAPNATTAEVMRTDLPRLERLIAVVRKQLQEWRYTVSEDAKQYAQLVGDWDYLKAFKETHERVKDLVYAFTLRLNFVIRTMLERARTAVANGTAPQMGDVHVRCARGRRRPSLSAVSEISTLCGDRRSQSAVLFSEF